MTVVLYVALLSHKAAQRNATQRNGTMVHFWLDEKVARNHAKPITFQHSNKTTLIHTNYFVVCFSCNTCHGHGRVMCWTCHGQGQLKMYIELTVKWWALLQYVNLELHWDRKKRQVREKQLKNERMILERHRLKIAQLLYFELFWPRIKSPLNRRKHHK